MQLRTAFTTGLLAVAGVLQTMTAMAAGELEDLARIRNAAETHAAGIAAGIAPLEATIRVSASGLDSRLRLPVCPAELETFTSPTQSGMPTSVGVRCQDGASWSLYVPVKVEAIAEVVVLSAPIQRGQPLAASDLRLEPRDISRLTRGYLTSIEATEGMVMKRQVQPGAVLNPSLIERERIVRRGQRVTLRAGKGGLNVSVEAEALADAARGDRLRVKNLSSGMVVEGTVESAGLVVMNR